MRMTAGIAIIRLSNPHRLPDRARLVEVGRGTNGPGRPEPVSSTAIRTRVRMSS